MLPYKTAELFLLDADCVNILEEIIPIWILLCGNSTFPYQDYSWILDSSSWLPSSFPQPLWLLNEIKVMLESRAQQQGVGGRGRVPHTGCSRLCCHDDGVRRQAGGTMALDASSLFLFLFWKMKPDWLWMLETNNPKMWFARCAALFLVCKTAVRILKGSFGFFLRV